MKVHEAVGVHKMKSNLEYVEMTLKKQLQIMNPPPHSQQHDDFIDLLELADLHYDIHRQRTIFC